MLGPALLKYGSEAHKKEHLPRIARGEIRWCQGYSEPNAGSDLASLQTKAEDKGDHFLINGQKVWTSYADKSDWIFCLVRTDPKAPKHEGISFLLLDMASEGVSTKPIRLISGSSPFCETFFDDVKVPKENLVGELNKGWAIAKYLLTHEREMIGASGIERLPGSDLGATAVEVIGTKNGALMATHDQLIAFGLSRRLVSEAVRELVFLGLVRAVRGRLTRGGVKAPNLYRLTFYADNDGSPATNEWKGKTEEAISAWKQEQAQRLRARRSRRRKQIPSSTSRTTIVRLSELRDRK